MEEFCQAQAGIKDLIYQANTNLGSVLFVSLHIIFSQRMLVRHNYEDMGLVNKSNIRDLFIICGFATKHREFCPNVPECY